jgi:hypothetical protein
MVATKEQIQDLLKPRLNYILLVAESSLSECQFRAFRKLTLDCFGKSGLEKDLEKVFGGDSQGGGGGRAGIHCAKERVHHD